MACFLLLVCNTCIVCTKTKSRSHLLLWKLMRVLIPVLEPVHKNCDIIALVLDTDMNYDSNTVHHIINVITKIQRQNSYDIIKNCGIIYMGYMKATFSSYYKDKHL